jgi:hypothetical protein
MGKSWILFLGMVLIGWSYSTPVAGEVLSNKKVTISVGNEQSWTGRNGTGNLSYYGCDRRNHKCVYLTGGTITCTNGVCKKTWRNKNYTYVLSSPLINVNNKGKTPSTLTIYSKSQVILKTELSPLPFDNINYQK